MVWMQNVTCWDSKGKSLSVPKSRAEPLANDPAIQCYLEALPVDNFVNIFSGLLSVLQR